ncbi:helicase-associated domain-containing protein [Luedemannella helvata]|uniref:Helicase XPB/Ssl2 N-terminal domain-containing protein n=1 Tax=Luedemannella helvata TaxID=349315 RepID=A0ABP4XDA5_9ACTN
MTSKLADQLRASPDAALATLLNLRPDLVVPMPGDLSVLAARSQSRVSVARALDGLDQFTLEILDGLRLVRGDGDTASVEALLALAVGPGVESADVLRAVRALRERFLVYGDETHLHLVAAIDEVTSAYPAGLGRPAAELDEAVASLVSDAAKLRRTLLSASPEARAVLDRLAAGPPIGTVRGKLLKGSDGDPDSPVRWLVGNRLLVAVSDDTVELPREVGLLLRRDAGPLGTLHPRPPEVDAKPRTVRTVDNAGAGQAMEAVRHLDTLLAELADAPAPVLKAGGMGVRDLRRLAKQAGTNEADTGTLLEVAYAAGLVAASEPTRTDEQRWLPTPAYDLWRASPLPQRWAVLGRTWLGMTRAPHLVGQRDDRDRIVGPLSPEVTRLGAPGVRRGVLGVLASLPPGVGPDADAVLAQLAWRAPRRYGGLAPGTTTVVAGPGGTPASAGLRAASTGAVLRAGSTNAATSAATNRTTAATGGTSAGPTSLTRATLAEAASLGVTGLGALTSYARLLLAEADRDPDDDPLGLRRDPNEPADALVAALETLLPEPVDHLLVQADLTVVVPGPPDPALAAELALVAEHESRGGAGVYRVTADSLRRALDAGYAASDLHGLFARRSTTPLPQALTYLIDDISRKHGGLRSGGAGAYLRSDDEALIAEVFADRRLATLMLRQLAPTVLVTGTGPGRLLEALREAGYAPVPEDAAGATLVTRPKAARATSRPAPRFGRPEDVELPRPTGPRLAAAVEQLRLGDKLARSVRRPPPAKSRLNLVGEATTPAQQHTQALAVLQQAMRDQAKVWVGYVDAHGSTNAKLVRPVSMAAGYLRAEDDRNEMLHTFALHRITSATLDE